MVDLAEAQRLITVAERALRDAEKAVERPLGRAAEHVLLPPIYEGLGEVLCMLSGMYADLARIRAEGARP